MKCFKQEHDRISCVSERLLRQLGGERIRVRRESGDCEASREAVVLAPGKDGGAWTDR